MRQFDEQNFRAAVSSLKNASELDRLISLMSAGSHHTGGWSGFSCIMREHYDDWSALERLPNGDEGTLAILDFYPETIEYEDFDSWNESYVGDKKAAACWDIAFRNYHQSLEKYIGDLLEQLNEPILDSLEEDLSDALDVLDDSREDVVAQLKDGDEGAS